MMATDNIHRPLDSSVPEIRLFTIEPTSSTDSPISGRLEIVSLESPPLYEALSYSWGGSERTSSITINDIPHQITPNLELALRGLRRQDAARVIWVDAICINQASFSERGHQVTLMGQIYSRCTCDLLWLGPISPINGSNRFPNEEEIGAGFSLMQTISDRDLSALEAMEENFVKDKTHRYQFIKDKFDPDTCNPKHKRLLSREEQRAIFDAFTYPSVWGRLWVMQEVSLAPKVILVAGPHTLDWDIVSGFLGDTPYADAFHGTFSHDVQLKIGSQLFNMAQIIDHQRRIMRDVRNGEGESKLLDVLARFKSTQATDPRDKIFGLLGLVTDHQDVQVDYTRPPALVYADTTALIINRSGNLDIICQSPWKRFLFTRLTRGNVLDDLPSWAADFQVDGRVSLFAQRSIFNAGAPKCETPCRRRENGSILSVKGISLGRIGPILQDDYFEKRRERWTTKYPLPLRWLSLYLGDDALLSPRPEHTYITGEPMFTAFWRTLVADCQAFPMERLTPEQIERETKDFNEKWSHTLRDKIVYEKNQTTDIFTDPGIDRLWSEFYDEWTFCMTDNGLFALIMLPTKEGDIVACLDGGKVPVILRPVQRGGEDMFELVAVAYVHGVMDMEATTSAELRERFGWEEQEFWLA